jgi:hypothetical protein
MPHRQEKIFLTRRVFAERNKKLAIVPACDGEACLWGVPSPYIVETAVSGFLP